MSIVESLLTAVREEIRQRTDATVLAVNVRIGALRLVVPETLRFCYAAATRATELSNSRLEIENVPALARCEKCGEEFAVESNWFQCSKCNEVGGKLLAGNELELVGITLAEPTSNV